MRPWVAMAAATLAACGTAPPTWTPDAGACQPYEVPASTDLMAPTVSFKTDVMKVFNTSCGTATCHGSSSSPTGGVFLGASTAQGSDAEAAFAAIVGVPSNELPTMLLVTPGDGSASYLMHKLDGDQCQFEMMCANQDCEVSMPSGAGSVLPVTPRDTVRRWIAQGAADN